MAAEHDGVLIGLAGGAPAQQHTAVGQHGAVHDLHGPGIALGEELAHGPQLLPVAGDAGDADGLGKAVGGMAHTLVVGLIGGHGRGAAAALASGQNGSQQGIQHQRQNHQHDNGVEQAAVFGIEITVEDLQGGPQIGEELVHWFSLLWVARDQPRYSRA